MPSARNTPRSIPLWDKPSSTLQLRGGINKRTPPKRSNGGKKHAHASNIYTINLPGPFSRLTEYAHIPLTDIQAYVSRDSATRQGEIQQPGRKRPKHCDGIPRPANAFLLYRMCYKLQARALCQAVTGSEQGVSVVCGASWRLETDDVRAGFKIWADVEAEKHREAFPDWRFKPEKAQGAPPQQLEQVLDPMAEEDAVISGPSLDLTVHDPEEEPGSHQSFPWQPVNNIAQWGWGQPDLVFPQRLAPDMSTPTNPSLLAPPVPAGMQFQNPYLQYHLPQQPVLCARCACVAPAVASASAIPALSVQVANDTPSAEGWDTTPVSAGDANLDLPHGDDVFGSMTPEQIQECIRNFDLDPGLDFDFNLDLAS